MAAHSSILAWRIPWTEEDNGLQFTGSQRVGYDWSDWALSYLWMSIDIVLQNINKHVSDGHRRIVVLFLFLIFSLERNKFYVNTVHDSINLKVYIEIENFMKRVYTISLNKATNLLKILNYINKEVMYEIHINHEANLSSILGLRTECMCFSAKASITNTTDWLTQENCIFS